MDSKKNQGEYAHHLDRTRQSLGVYLTIFYILIRGSNRSPYSANQFENAGVPEAAWRLLFKRNESK